MLADNTYERVHSAPPDSAWSRPDKNLGKEHSARWNVANPVLSSGRVSKVKSCRERTFSGVSSNTIFTWKNSRTEFKRIIKYTIVLYDWINIRRLILEKISKIYSK